MIVETARVVGVQPNGVILEAERLSACRQCQSQSSCGQKSLQQWVDSLQSSNQFVALNPNSLALYPGDQVRVGIEEGSLLRLSALLYALPLLSMLLGVLVSSYLRLSEGGVVLTALTLLGIGFGLVRYLSRYFETHRNYQPVVLKTIK